MENSNCVVQYDFLSILYVIQGRSENDVVVEKKIAEKGTEEKSTQQPDGYRDEMVYGKVKA